MSTGTGRRDAAPDGDMGRGNRVRANYRSCLSIAGAKWLAQRGAGRRWIAHIGVSGKGGQRSVFAAKTSE